TRLIRSTVARLRTRSCTAAAKDLRAIAAVPPRFLVEEMVGEGLFTLTATPISCPALLLAASGSAPLGMMRYAPLAVLLLATGCGEKVNVSVNCITTAAP